MHKLILIKSIKELKNVTFINLHNVLCYRHEDLMDMSFSEENYYIYTQSLLEYNDTMRPPRLPPCPHTHAPVLVSLAHYRFTLLCAT